VFHVPKRLVGKGKIPQLRADFVKAIGAERVFAVQILPNHKVWQAWKAFGKPGKKLEVVLTNVPSPNVRTKGKS
jgi:hypothetical protein